MKKQKKLVRAVSGLTLLSAAMFAGQAAAITFGFVTQGGFAPDFSSCTDGSVPGTPQTCLEYDQRAPGTGPVAPPHAEFEGAPLAIPVGPGFDGPPTNVPAGVYNTWHNMQWDHTPTQDGFLDDRRSRLETDFKTGTIEDNNTQELSAVITHYNTTLDGEDDTLFSSVILDSFGLFDPLNGNALVFGGTLPFRFEFFETPNSSGNCPDFQESSTPCDDIFTLLNTEFLNASVDFSYLGVDYALQISIEGLTFFQDPDDPTRTLGRLVTTEAGQEDFRVFLALTSEDTPGVPEPASLALMGVGLMGLGAVRRRRSKDA